ncbi:RagB/SusD family nutrient uptake outer membrane protein [Myroides sp. LoEW2-1]|uniref:RagB/SusD family nutrient uptake outer membrane protein n=1 Tax=Myroides sp. LoEW2-1 TaxID=2683192 RepID=UPI0013283CAD|nr:RagB/SusD family nutrient uptake outer membrane protein [Myroides sp. LoEW2-1]MVX35481.1 RagB/SusD family nutrient uptake outer membrane protein [Myroides sp. LoEW2-1]
MKKIIMLALGAGLFLGSCSKDFLDVSSTRYLSKSDMDKISDYSTHLKDATLYGLYAYNIKAFAGGTTGHDDFGQKGFDIYTDMLSGDMNLNSNIYGWYSNIANFSEMENYASNPNYKPWRFYYFMIRSTNQIIGSLAGEDGTKIPESNKDKVVLAEAKAIRAYMYYNLVNMYTLGYDANQKVLPIYKTATLINQPSKPTKEVYEFMVNDLKESMELFESANATETRIDRITVDYMVTKGILAYVYASQGDAASLVESARLSKELIDSGNYPLATKEGLLKGFNKTSENPNWLWGGRITTQTDLDLVSWWGQVDVFTYSYAGVGDTKGMSKELYESIKDEDVRKKQFVFDKVTDNNGETESFGDNAYIPAGKFYAATGKFHLKQRIIESDYVFMRIEEMYLLNAEVNARLGNDADAKQVLKDMLDIRLGDTSFVDGLSGDKLVDEILHQTSIELWGEGKIYAAVKRNKKSFTYGSNHLSHPKQTFNYDDPRLTFKVPQSELLNNPVYND